MQLVIERGVPIPPKGPGGRKKGVPLDECLPHFLRQLQPGDSVLTWGARSSSCAEQINQVRRETGFTFVTRMVNGRLRIWRAPEEPA